MNNELTQVQELETKQNEVVTQAKGMVITAQEHYDNAMTFLKNIKSVGKNIETYWADPKAKANAVWKDIVAKEKAMLAPLSEAETVVKGKMKTFADEQDRIARELQRQQEEARRIEADRLMKEAAESEAQGETLQAEIQMQMAATMETPQAFGGATKQQGVREVKKLSISDESKVPTYVNGICIRPVDMTAVKKIYELTGKLPDGIEMIIEKHITVR